MNRKSTNFKLVCLIVFVLAWVGIIWGMKVVEDKRYVPSYTRIRVIETSDIHGHFVDVSSGDEDTFEYRMAYIADVVNDARANDLYDDVLLLDGGDTYQGEPISNLLYGNPLRAILNEMDYDAVGLGNHEFDWGVTDYSADDDGTVAAYDIGGYVADPEIPIVAYDLFDAETGKRVDFTQDYVVVNKAGYRIAIIGYIPDYSIDIITTMIEPYTIRGDLEELKDIVSYIIEMERPDVTVILAHEDAAIVAEAMDHDEVDLVVGGHSHDGIYGVASSDVPYIQPDKYCVGYGSATIVIDDHGNVTVEELMYNDITSSPELLYDNEANKDNLDPTVLDISHKSWELLKEEMNVELGYIVVPVMKHDEDIISDIGTTTSSGNFITGLMLRGTSEYETVAAFFNTGGFRCDLLIPEGESRRVITVGDVYSFSPFNNTWLIYELTGEEIAQQIHNGFVEGNYGNQVSGLTFNFINHGTEEEPDVEVLSITLSDGTPVDVHDDVKTYRVVTTNYSALLEGSVFEGKTPLVPESDAPIDNMTIVELLREEAAENGGLIYVDYGQRGIEVDK